MDGEAAAPIFGVPLDSELGIASLLRVVLGLSFAWIYPLLVSIIDTHPHARGRVRSLPQAAYNIARNTGKTIVEVEVNGEKGELGRHRNLQLFLSLSSGGSKDCE